MARDFKDIEKLAEELATLSPDERAKLWASVARRTASEKNRPHMPWSNLEALLGIVSLGGDAVEDCARLYNG